MVANSFGSRLVTLPLYFASNAFARSSASLRVASIFGSSGDVKRSVRFHRTFSAPVVFRAWTTNSGYPLDPLGELAHPRRIRPASRVRAFIDRVGQFTEKRGLHRDLVFERCLGGRAAPSQTPLHLLVKAQQLVLSRSCSRADIGAAAAKPGVREDDDQADRNRRRDHGQDSRSEERRVGKGGRRVWRG